MAGGWIRLRRICPVGSETNVWTNVGVVISFVLKSIFPSIDSRAGLEIRHGDAAINHVGFDKNAGCVGRRVRGSRLIASWVKRKSDLPH